MGRYIQFDDVRIRLIGKVKFTDNPARENEMSIELANRLINEGEGQVELDLSPRYFAPFQPDGGGSFSDLPDRPTREILRTLCEIQGVIKILDIDFGRGTVVNAATYYENLDKRYRQILGDLLGHRDGYGSGWKYPPLPGIQLNYQNAVGDDGFVGSVLVAGSGDESGAYPSRRINDPSRSFWWNYDGGTW